MSLLPNTPQSPQAQPSSSTQAQDPTQLALLAVQALFHNPDKDAKKRANEWLSEFQHTNEAWQTCHAILNSPSPEIRQEARMMAAQTLRSKVVYDLSQLPPSSLPSLRDSFLQSLTTYSAPAAPSGSRTIVTQLCLALSDLAFQMPEWKDVVTGMIENFGNDPGKVEMLLEFLKCLVEEAENGRIPISNTEARSRSEELLSKQSDKVLSLLTMYINAPGVTPKLQAAVFETLRSWLRAGELDASLISKSPLFEFSFSALANIELFDHAVDVICDMIHETQEVEDNVEVVQKIVPRVIGLRPAFLQAVAADDPDAVRGFCRIFTEAGETYRQLILQHPQTFLTLVQAIGECAAYHDLDIVPITFNFWYKLSQALGKRSHSENPANSQFAPFLEVYASLQESMTYHLRFPDDETAQTAESRDEFRGFRHQMGDTLKDCCQVLGANVCMKRAYDMVMTAMEKGPGASWQEIEAPLFSMRAMGAEVDSTDDEVLPKIMDMLPTLPRHSRIQYAATLVISRYTQWIDAHPQYLPFQLQYISEGFQVTQDEVSLAAALAMKYMCQDCKEHLVPYLGQLYSFVTTAGLTLSALEKADVAEAIGYVISCMSVDEAAGALRKFCQPLLDQIQQALAGPLLMTREELTPVLDALEQLEAYVINVQPLDTLPPACKGSPGDIYNILDLLLEKYYSSYSISDKTCRLIRRGFEFFPFAEVQTLLPRLLPRLLQCFEGSGHSSFLWIVGKTVGLYGDRLSVLGGTAEGTAMQSAYTVSLERMTAAVKHMEEQSGAIQIPDVIEDYLQAIVSYLKRTPAILMSSPALPSVFDLILSALTLPAPETVICALELVIDLLKIGTADASPYLQVITNAVKTYGERVIGLSLNGMVQDYPEESQEYIIDALKEMVKLCPLEAKAWTEGGIDKLPGHIAPASDKQEFYNNFGRVFAETNLDLIKPAVRVFFRSARRAKDRKDRLRSSLGGSGR